MNAFDVSRMLWDYYLWASVLLVVTLCANFILTQPARRMAVAWATAGGLLVLLLLTALPNWSRYSLASPAPPPVVPVVERIEPVAIAAPQVEIVAPRDIQPRPVVEPAPVRPILRFNWQGLLLWALGAGSLGVIGWLALGSWQARRLRTEASTVPADVAGLFAQLVTDRHHEIELGVHRELPVAVALGLRRPCILLPQTLINLPNAGQLRSVLAHELAHVEHRDLWLLAVLRLVTVVLWPHPLFWLLKRQVRHDQEVLADTAAAELTSRTDYAEQLVALARAASEVRIPRLASSVGLWEKRTQLTERIKLLLDEKLTILRNCSRGWRLGSLVGLGGLAFTLSLVTLSPRIAQSRVETETRVNEETATVSPEEFAKLVQQAETKEGFAHAVGDLVAAAIRPSQLPFINEERLAGIRGKFVNFVTQHMPADISAKRRAELLRGLRDHAQQHLQLPGQPIAESGDLNNVYLNFADRVKTLQWELGMALTRGPLDETAVVELESQRNWMRKTIAAQPELRHTTHEQVLKDLDAVFADPLCVIFDRPMSEEAFGRFQAEINNWLAGEPKPNSLETFKSTPESQLPYMVHHLLIEAMSAQYRGERTLFDGPSFDSDEISGYGANSRVIHLGFASNRTNESSSLALDDFGKSGNSINADTGYMASPAAKGDFAFAERERKMIAINGAKLLPLEVANWIEADAISTEDLKARLTASGDDEVDLEAFLQHKRERFIQDFQQGRVESRYTHARNLEEALQAWEGMQDGEGPYVAVLTNEGNVAVTHLADLRNSSTGSMYVRTRVRPGASRAPESNPNDVATVQLVAAAPGEATEKANVVADEPKREPITTEESWKRIRAKVKHVFDARKPNEIVGICLDEFGNPLVGANVEVCAAPFRGRNQEPQLIASMRSDSKGEFHFKNVIDIEQEFPNGLPDDNNFLPDNIRVITVIARLPGRVPGNDGNELAAEVARSGRVSILRMPSAQALSGRVIDEGGHPAEGAKVSIGDWARVVGAPDDINSATTNANGEFEIADLEAYDSEQARKEFESWQQNNYTLMIAGANSGQPWERFVTVEHSKFARKRAKITSIPGSVDVTLSPGAVLTGQVVTQEAGGEPKPAANVEVTAMLLPAAESPNSLSYQVLSAKTDEAGNYRFESLPKGSYAVHANLPGWVTNGLEDVNVATGEAVEVPELTMTRGARVRIQLVDDATGKPLTFDKPTKAYVNPVQRPMKKNIFAMRPNIVEFSREGMGEIQVPDGSFLFNVTIPSKEGATGWMRADFNINRSNEELESVPGQKVNEGEVVEIEVRMVPEEAYSGDDKDVIFVPADSPTEIGPTGDLIPATAPAETETQDEADKQSGKSTIELDFNSLDRWRGVQTLDLLATDKDDSSFAKASDTWQLVPTSTPDPTNPSVPLSQAVPMARLVHETENHTGLSPKLLYLAWQLGDVRVHPKEWPELTLWDIAGKTLGAAEAKEFLGRLPDLHIKPALPGDLPPLVMFFEVDPTILSSVIPSLSHDGFRAANSFAYGRPLGNLNFAVVTANSEESGTAWPEKANIELDYAMENWRVIRTVTEVGTQPIEIAEGVRWYLDPERARERDPNTGRLRWAEGKTAGVLETLRDGGSTGFKTFAARVFLKGQTRHLHHVYSTIQTREGVNYHIEVSDSFDSANQIERVEILSQRHDVIKFTDVPLRLDLLPQDGNRRYVPITRDGQRTIDREAYENGVLRNGEVYP